MGEIRAGARCERIILLSPARRTRKVMAETYGPGCVLSTSVKLIKKRVLCNEAPLLMRLCVCVRTYCKVVFFSILGVVRSTKEELNSIFGCFIAAAAGSRNSLFLLRRACCAHTIVHCAKNAINYTGAISHCLFSIKTQ